MRYVTREGVHVDRIATAWAIRRFIDREAAFEFVPRGRDLPAGAIAFDMRGAQIGHHGGRCTFETLLQQYELEDPGLKLMGLIIRGADLPDEPDPPPESAGVAAIFDGLRTAYHSDAERLRVGQEVCEALYRYCCAVRPARTPG